jgi:hypothetical protein
MLHDAPTSIKISRNLVQLLKKFYLKKWFVSIEIKLKLAVFIVVTVGKLKKFRENWTEAANSPTTLVKTGLHWSS